MSFPSKVSIAFAIALFPMSAAAAPGNVENIEGEIRDGKAYVSWQKPDGDEPKSYRVFYSRASILQQNGLYDDFETVQAPATEFTFESLPYATNVLYVSVLAVNAKGEESPLFMEEAKIDFGAPQAAVSSSSMSSGASSKATSSVAASTPGNGGIQMLSVKAVSATGAMVTFSGDVQVDATKAATAFVIKDASGSTLRVTRLVILGKEVTLLTVPQEIGRVYRLEVSPAAITGTNGAKLDPQQGALLFMGSPDGVPAQQSSSARSSGAASSFSMPSMAARDDVRTLQLRGQAKGNVYTVEASWQAPATGTVKEYRISQSRDRGRTYSQPQTVPAGATGVKIDNVTGGDFGLNVQAVYADGGLSRGVFQTINLPAKGGSTLPGNVIGPIPNPDRPGMNKPTGDLSGSGMEAAIPVLVSAAGAGYEVWRRRKLTAKREATIEA